MSYESELGRLAAQDERIMVLTAENRAPIRGLPQKLGDRFVDTGIAEQTLIGMSAGLALRGRIPVAHALATFLTLRPFEFIRTDVGIPHLPVKLVGYVPGILSEANGPTHQALEDISLMRGIPGLNVFSPADHDELCLGLPAIINDPAPWYIRYVDRPAAVNHDPGFVIGKAEVVRDGTDVTILVHGALFAEAHEAAVWLETSGISARLVNMRTVKPVDEEVILAAAAQTRLLVTVEDHFLTGGLASIVSEVLVRRGARARLHPISFGDRWFRPGRLHDVLEAERLLGPQIATRIVAALEESHVH